MRRDVARRRASWEGGSRGPAPREVRKGEGRAAGAGPPRAAPALARRICSRRIWSRRILSPRAEGASGSGERCQPCPGVKDGAQPTSCPPPPPPAGKMLLSPLLLEGPFCLPPHRPSAPCTACFLRSDFSIALKEGKSKRGNCYTKSPRENSSSRGTGAWQELTMPKNQQGEGWSQ